MRVTDRQAFDTMNRQITNARTNTMKAQEQASSGLKVARPSDDPVAAAAARRENARKVYAESGARNTQAATLSLETSESALGDAFDLLGEASARAVEGSSDSLNAENRRALAIEVRRIRETMISTANTNIDGKYVFAGYRDHDAPYAADGEFTGDESTREIEVMPNVRLKTSVSGPSVFGEAGSDAFKVLDDLATALESNDGAGARSAIGLLQQAQERVSEQRSKVGAMMDSADMARNVSERHALSATTEVGRLTEIDEFEAATNLLRARSALDAAVAVAQQIPVGSLVQQSR